ncbi:MAG: hypothetical protein ACI80V_002407 [Rhodothermales bacterium]|jgi:hypothetical protein
MVANPSEAGVIYAGTFGTGVFYSQNYGYSWQELDDPGTVGNENAALLDVDLSGDDFAGHVFDLEFSPDADFLFIGTARGVWRADLETFGPTPNDFSGTWTAIGPTVTLDGSLVTPEVGNLAFAPDGAGYDLVGGTWGFGAYLYDPAISAASGFLALREGNVTLVAASASGTILLGSESGETETVTSASATSTAVGDPGLQLPAGYSLDQNYPNPFSSTTTIAFAVPETTQAKLSIFDSLGREIAVLIDGVVEAGTREVRFSKGQLPAGVYLYRLRTSGGVITKALLFL